MDQPGKAASPARGQLNREINIALSPLTAENLLSRDRFGNPVPRQPAHFPHSGSIWCLLKGLLLLSAAASIFYTANRHRVSPEFYQITQLLTDGIHCRESTGTGPLVPKVLPVTGAAFLKYHHGPIHMPLSFATPFKNYWYVVGMCDTESTVSEAMYG